MSYNKTWYLHESTTVRIRDFVCRAPRAHCGHEQCSTADHLLFTRRGVFVKHGGAHDGTPVTAEPAHILLYNVGEEYHTSHPGDEGDMGTVFEYARDTVREVIRRYDAAVDDRAREMFTAPSVLAAPDTLTRTFRLRRRLEAGVASALETEEESLAILADTVRAIGAAPPAPRARGDRRRRREIVEHVKQRLAAEPGANPTLATLGAMVDLSPFHLTRVFRSEVGVPVHQYLLRLRLALALDRLADPATSLSAVGLDLGFASHSHFTSAFRRHYGAPPSAVRAAGRAPVREGEARRTPIGAASR